MDPVVYPSATPQLNALPLIDENKVINDAHAVAISRLKLKFPGRTIGDHEVQFDKITPKIFSTGGLDCGSGGITTQGRVPGYILSFTYNHETFHLHTKKGETYLSPDLKIESYPLQMLTHIQTALTKKVNEDVTADNIALQKAAEEDGTALTYWECNQDFDKYIAQREKVFVFQVSYKNALHEFCMNEQGEPRHVLL